MEKEQAAIQLQARQRGRAQRKKLEERLQAKKEGRAWKGKQTALQQNGLDEAVLASGAVKLPPIKQPLTQEQAAVKIQAHIRGRQHRRKMKQMQEAHEAEEAEQKLKHEQKTKREKSKLEQRLAKKKGQSLAPDPESPGGRMIVLEQLGGNDKQKKGPAQGHRRDTFPLCNAVIGKGWSCQPVLYSDADYDSVATTCAEADAVIVRASTGAHEGVTTSKLDALLRGLAAEGKTVLPHPDTAARLGAKASVSKMDSLACGMSGTLVYNDAGAMRTQLPASLAGGARVLKANRGSQGSAVWLCTIAGEGEVTVQYGKDNSTETMMMDELLAKLEQEGFNAAVQPAEEGYCSEAGEACYLVDQMYFPEVGTVGELRVTMIGNTPHEIQKRTPAKGGFSATFKSGAKFEKCPPEADAESWARARSALSGVEGLPAAVGCPAGTALPLLWAVELLPYAGSGCVAGEIDCGCIGVATSAHLLPAIAETAIALAKKQQQQQQQQQ
jgi:glutathione synthase/RimK-type ligase-like ATP-grasp enzyme